MWAKINERLMRLFPIVLLLLSAQFLPAQTAGRILFEERMDLHKNLPPDREELKDMIPQYNTSEFELYFQDSITVYKAKKQLEDPAETTAQSGNTRMSMRWGGRDNRVVYKNVSANQMIDSREFMQKQFLIQGTLDNRKWKVTGRQQEILGQLCLSATTTVDTFNVEAWFAPQLAPHSGPADYQGLPGMVLKVDIDNGFRTITAKEILYEPVDPEILVAPSKGKEVTAEEFEQIRQEKMKEMGGMNGRPGPGMHMIMIRN